MKRQNKLIMAMIVVAAAFLFGLAAFNKVSAAGQPYAPYPFHEPEDTGLITSQLYLIAGGAFTGGFSILSKVKAIERRIK
jgi:hypothetical protein